MATPQDDDFTLPDLDDGVPTDDTAEPDDADVAHAHGDEDVA